MKITKLTTYPVPPRWLFLKIETDEGLRAGASQSWRAGAATVAACVDELAHYLIDCDPRNIEDLWQLISRRVLSRRTDLDERYCRN